MEGDLEQDPRYQWLKAKTCTALGCELEDFDPLLKSEEYVHQLRGFLDGGTHILGEGSSKHTFFGRRYYMLHERPV